MRTHLAGEIVALKNSETGTENADQATTKQVLKW